MPDLLKQISGLYGNSSYDNPILEVGGWHIFCDEDGFIPAANNLMLIGKCLAWKRGTDRYYLSFIGVTNGAYEYRRGELLPEDIISRCHIDAHWFHAHDIEDIGPEIVASLTELTELVCRSEGIENPLIAKPLTVQDISLPEKVLWSGESRGDRYRVVRREDYSISFQVANSYDVNGEPDAWSTIL